MTPHDIVKRFISENWSDQKVAEVLAFNEDGKMSFCNPCACILGVSSSNQLHELCTTVHLYDLRKQFGVVELAYRDLWQYSMLADRDAARRESIDAILREIIGEREARRASQAQTQETPCLTP